MHSEEYGSAKNLSASLSAADLRNSRRISSTTFLTAKIESDSESAEASDTDLPPQASDAAHAAATSSSSRLDIRTAETLVASRKSEVDTADSSFSAYGTTGVFSRRFRFTRSGSGRSSAPRPISGRNASVYRDSLAVPDASQSHEQQQQQWNAWQQLWIHPSQVQRKSVAETGESLSLSFVTDAVMNISEKVATDPSSAPSFTQLDLANIIDRSLERFNVPVRAKMWQILQDQHEQFQSFRNQYLEYQDQHRRYRQLIQDQQNYRTLLAEHEQRLVEFKEQQRALLHQQEQLREKIKEHQQKQMQNKQSDIFDDSSSAGSDSQSSGSTPLPPNNEVPEVAAEAHIQEQIAQLKPPVPPTQPPPIIPEPTPPEMLANPPVKPISLPNIGISGEGGELIDSIDQDTPQSPTEHYSQATALEAMNIKNKILNQIISELGRRVNKFQRHNADLIQANAALVRERDVARQARDDLHIILQEKNAVIATYESGHDIPQSDEPISPTDAASMYRLSTSKQDTQTKQKPSHHKRKLRPGRVEVQTRRIQFVEREFFDQDTIISAALEQLHAQVTEMSVADAKTQSVSTSSHVMDTTTNQHIPDTTAPQPSQSNVPIQDMLHDTEFVLPDFHTRINAEIIKYSAQMASIKKQYDPPTPVGIGLKHNADTCNLLKSNPYRDVRTSRSSIITTNYHPKRLQQLIMHARDHVAMLTNMMARQRQSLIEAKTPDRYVKVLHQQLNETTASLHECLDALAEEQKHARRWRGQCEMMAQRLEDIRKLFDRERVARMRFQAKRQACMNAVMPIARPVTSSAAVVAASASASDAASPSFMRAHHALLPYWAWNRENDLWKMRALRDNDASVMLHQELLARIATAARAAAAAAVAATNTAAASPNNANIGVNLSTQIVDDGHHGSEPRSVEMAVMNAAMNAALEALENRADPPPTIIFTPPNTQSAYPPTTAHQDAPTRDASNQPVDVLAGTIDERSLPPLPPRQVPIMPPSRESRLARPQAPIDKVPIYVPILGGVPTTSASPYINTLYSDHVTLSRPGTVGSISAFDYTRSTTPTPFHVVQSPHIKSSTFRKAKRHLEHLQII